MNPHFPERPLTQFIPPCFKIRGYLAMPGDSLGCRSGKGGSSVAARHPIICSPGSSAPSGVPQPQTSVHHAGTEKSLGP